MQQSIWKNTRLPSLASAHNCSAPFLKRMRLPKKFVFGQSVLMTHLTQFPNVLKAEVPAGSEAPIRNNG